MTICRFSIIRPVVTIVFMLLLIVFGYLSMNMLAVREYPDIDTPTISIRTNYDGASASVVETKITRIIEDAVAGIEGLDNISSTSMDGRSNVTLEFRTERDIDAAANDVRDKVSRILKNLPDEADAPVVAKYDSSGMPVLIVALTSTKRTPMELTDYADRYLVDRYSVIDGVASADVFGAQEQSMRIWLDRLNMAARGITVNDIQNVLKAENLESPGGRIESNEREFVVRVNRRYHTPADFANMVLKQNDSGDFIRLGDMAKVELAPRSLRQSFTSNKEPMITIGVSKQSTANTLSVVEGAKELTEKIKADLPEDMEMEVLRDDSLFIQAAIDEVIESLIITAILVLLIIFLFLGDLRASLIPAFTVPISLTASFIVLALAGYSINLLTLLALVLAIGLVVDDTIVMLENIHRRIKNGEPPMVAAVRGADQVIFAVIATTVVLIAVFMPICLWEGKTGKLFAEFAVAISAAVCFSSVVALTLTPMLCSKMLKQEDNKSLMIRMVNTVIGFCEKIYNKSLRTVAKAKILTFAAFIAICILTVWGWMNLPSEYEPEEDRAVIMLRMQAPEGTNYYTMSGYANQTTDVVFPLLEEGSAKNLMVVVPTFGDSEGAVNRGFAILELQEWGNRQKTARQILDKLRGDLNTIPGLPIQPFLPNGIGSRGNPVQFVIGGPEYPELIKWRDIILEKCKSYPGFVDIQWDYKETTPQLHVDIDTKRADELGVSTEEIGATLETMLGSKKVTTYVDRGQEYDVVLQADRFSRATPDNLSNIYVRSKHSGELIPLSNVVTITEKGDAGRLSRYNRVRAITISGNVAPGYALSDVLDFLEKTAKENLPEYRQIFYKGQSKDMKESSSSMIYIFALALLVSYLALAAQFESFLCPLIVMFTVPLGMVGAIAALMAMGLTMNIYTQIGIIMLIGLAAKNGILIVEFANQLRDAGKPFEEALFEASKLRLRPILMTAISTVIGAVPLLLASGAGAASRKCLGAVIVYGGLSSCILTLFIVPVAYLALAKWERSPKALQRQLDQMEKEVPDNEI
ncbi:MAG: efflux RND transporter permease subunit [Lentisphaeria bacterium]|nr:efflux RND transporter permease subunit [Lentisphaeria bacterium]